MLRRRVLRDEYMKNEELKKKNTKRNQQEEEGEGGEDMVRLVCLLYNTIGKTTYYHAYP